MIATGQGIRGRGGERGSRQQGGKRGVAVFVTKCLLAALFPLVVVGVSTEPTAQAAGAVGDIETFAGTT